MSFEGYYEYGCKCGNIDCADVYDSQPTYCAECGSSFKTSRLVDQTNGLDEVGEWKLIKLRPEYKDYINE